MRGDLLVEGDEGAIERRVSHFCPNKLPIRVRFRLARFFPFDGFAGLCKQLIADPYLFSSPLDRIHFLTHTRKTKRNESNRQAVARTLVVWYELLREREPFCIGVGRFLGTSRLDDCVLGRFGSRSIRVYGERRRG